MKKNLPFRKALILIGIMTFCLSVLAQSYPDYVITVAGDSIPCKITSPPFDQHYKYKTESMSKPKSIQPDEIREFAMVHKNLHQRSILVDSNLNFVFADVIEKGKINLYQIFLLRMDQVQQQSGMQVKIPTTLKVSKEMEYLSAKVEPSEKRHLQTY